MKSLTLRLQNRNDMNIAMEKAEVLKRFEKVHDPSLIKAIKNLLDFGLSKQEAEDEALEASIDRGLRESMRGETIPHEQAMKEIRSLYKP
jgi:predicted transcriptional regulator